MTHIWFRPTTTSKWQKLTVHRVTNYYVYVEKHWRYQLNAYVERIPRRGYPGCYALTDKEKDDKIYRDQNVIRISEKVRSLSADMLRKVEKLIEGKK